MMSEPWDKEAFTGKLREVGSRFYHDKHPFHIRMNSGALDRESIAIWAANRFYYQINIPIKDAAILSNCPVREIRRTWIHRIMDHDGGQGDEGGIGAWMALGRACGLAPDEMWDGRHVVPGVRFAVDAYVDFARRKPWPIAIASSLTELFAPDLMSKRLEAFERHYTWVEAAGLQYFKNRLTQAKRDSGEALAITHAYCVTRELQEEAVRALGFKCDLLWAQLDAIHNKCAGLAKA